MALMIAKTAKDSAFRKPSYLDQQVLNCLSFSVAVHSALLLSSSALDVLVTTISRVAQPIGLHFVFPKVTAKSQQELEDTASERDRCCQSHYRLQLSFMQDSSSWQSQNVEFSRNQQLGDFAFISASHDAVATSSWSYISPASQHYLSASTVSSISILPCLLQLRFSFQETLEGFEVHYPYLIYSTFQLIQILTIIAVFPINFLPLDSQSIPHY